MALRDIRLPPYVWSIRQALAWGAVLGIPCGLTAWLLGWRPVASPAAALADLLVALLVVAALSALCVAFAALLRNALTRFVYRSQKLETLRGAVWGRNELAVAGALSFAVLLPVLASGSRAVGWPSVDLHPAIVALIAAVFGSLYLPLTGLLRRLWIARRQV